MDILLHASIIATFLRLIRAGKWVIIMGALGAAIPDISSAVEHVVYWAGLKDTLWVWRGWFHGYQGFLVVGVAAMWIGLLLMIAERRHIFPAIALCVGYLTHIVVDVWWHKPVVGGWCDNCYWYNAAGWVVIVAINLPWLIAEVWPWLKGKLSTN